MFSNFDPFKNYNGFDIYNFEMAPVAEGVLMLQEDLCGSFYKDYFTIDGSKYDGQSDTPFSFTTTKWVHEPIEDVDEQYLPVLTIATDYSFSYLENVYVGMGEYTGYCQKNDNI